MSSHSSLVLGLAAAVVVVGGACSDSSDGGSPSSSSGSSGTAPSGLPCDVDRILDANCRTCHASPPSFGASSAMTTWDELHADATSDPSKKVYQLVGTRIADLRSPMPPPPNARLSVEDRKILSDWAAAGAPKSTDACGTVGTGDGGAPPGPDCKGGEKISLGGTPYTMPTTVGDQYVCWGVDLAQNPAKHITTFSPRIDNKTIVHHIVLYESATSYSTTPTPCSAAASFSWRMVYGWAPGGKGLELPPDVGFPIGTTSPTHYVAVLHYSNPQRKPDQKDASGVDLCVSAPRANEADVLAFGSQSFTIPAQPPVGGVFKIECSLTVPPELAGRHAFAAMPHMHKIGAQMSTVLTPKAGGPDVDLGTVANYSFDTQAWLPISATTGAGDIIRTRCGWTNTTGAEVRFGEKTADEMCYSFTMYYPRINVPLWSWAIPASGAPLGMTCSPL